LVFLGFSMLSSPSFASETTSTEGEAVFVPIPLSASDASPCVNDVVTVTASVPDESPTNPVTDVRWQVFFNGALLTDAQLPNFIALDAAVGATLDDWSLSTTLTFEVLAEGCYTVSVVNESILLTSTAQEILPVTIKSSGVPQQPTVSGFDVLMCEGSALFGTTSSFIVGETGLDLAYELSGPHGFLFTGFTSSTGEACDGPSANLTLPATVLNDPGSYIFTATATNTNGCGLSTNSLDIEVVTYPVFALTTTPICAEEDATVLSDIDAADYAMSDGQLPVASAIWSNGETDLSSAVYSTPENNDTFSQTVELTYSFAGVTETCSADASVSQVVHLPEVVELTYNEADTPGVLCEDLELVLSVVMGAVENQTESYAWTTSPLPNVISGDTYTWEAVDEDITVEIIQTSVYSDGTTCDNAASPFVVTVPVTAKPVIGWATGDDAVCEGESSTLEVQVLSSSGPSTELTWTSGSSSGSETLVGTGNVDILIPGSSFVGSGSQVVSVSPEDAFGCVGASIEGLVEHYALPTPSGTLPFACSGEAVSPENVPTGPEFTYAWSYDGLAFGGDGATTATPVFDGISCDSEVSLVLSQTYVIDGVPLVCSAEAFDFSVEVAPTPEFNLSVPAVLCDDNEIDLAVTPVPAETGCLEVTTEYVWNVDDGTGLNATSSDEITLAANDYDTIALNVVATSTGVADNSQQCTSELNTTLEVNANPVLDALPGDLAFCANSSVAVSAAVLDDPNGGLTYTWSNGDTPPAFEILTNGAATTGVALASGSNATDGEVVLTVTDAAGCTAEVSTVLDVLDLPSPNGVTWSELDGALCSGDELTVDMAAPSVDPTLNLGNVTATWTASGSNGANYTVTPGTGDWDQVVTGMTLLAAAWNPSNQPSPTLVSFELVLNDGTCQASYAYPDEIELYPNPKVSNMSDNDVCVGTDWSGLLTGASSIEWPTNGASSSYDAVLGGVEWNVPWGDIDITTTSVTTVPFDLTAYADYGDALCVNTWTLNLAVLENPEINFATTSVPSSICEGSTVNVSGGWVPGTGQGAPTRSWSNADTPGTFNLVSSPNGASANVSLTGATPIPDTGSLTFTIEDVQGCMAEETFVLTIIELPVIGELSVVPDFNCAEEAFDVSVSEVTVDDGLDPLNVTYGWRGTLGVQGSSVTVTGSGNVVSMLPEMLDVAFQDFVAPEQLEVTLEASISGCTNTATWTDVVDIYPLPDRSADNVNVCANQDWEATVTGCEVLTVYGSGGLPDITWTAADPGTGMNVVLTQDYMNAPSGVGQNVNQTTFDFYAGVTYADVDLTCFNERPFVLTVRAAPNFSVTGDDTSGPAGDLVMCEGEDMVLNSFFNQGGASEAFSWAQYVPDGAGGFNLTPLSWSTEEAFFVDEMAAAPFDEPTVIEGLAYITYTYNTAPGFECVVEEPWSFQVLPTPEVEFTVLDLHTCSGEDATVQVALTAGATSLNGTATEWDWDWDVSTFNNVIHTTDPFDEVQIPALYQNSLTGMFEQDMSVVVTDSYGCISLPSEASFVALESPVVGLERPLVCADDTLEILATGADVYTWSVDLTALDGDVTDAVYFPNYVPTGDSLQTLSLFTPVHGVSYEVTGSLVYPLETGETLTCEDNANVVSVVYDVPVLDINFTSDPAPYCDGDVMTFEDVNTGSNPGNTAYDYWTSGGVELNGEPSPSMSFTLFAEATTFEVTKVVGYPAQGSFTYCSTFGTQTFDVVANPVISLDGSAGICQDGEGTVVCEISDENPDWDYSVTWTGSSNVDADANPNDPFELTVSSADGVTPSPSEPLSFTAFVTDENGCVSEQESYDMEVLATPILEITDPLLEDHCSPAQDCMQVALLNEDLDVNLGVLYFWDNQPGSTTNSHCVNYVNPTPCPFLDSMNVTVRFAHVLAGGETVFCLNSTVDSTVVNPTPSPQFSLTAPQACLDTAGGNCVPFEHDTTAYDVCFDDSLSYEWFVTPLGELIQNDLNLEAMNTPFPTVCLDTAGVVNLVLEITNQYGCSQTTANVPYTVRGLPVPELTFAQTSICLPTTVEVLNSSSGASDFTMSIPGYPTYENFLSPLVLEVEYPGYYNAEFSVSNTHTIGSHQITCTVETEYIKAFEGRTPPVAEFAVLPDTLIEFVNPVVEFVNLSEGQIDNIWSFGNGEGSSELDPEVEYEAAGMYNAQLLVVNEFGCTDVFSQEIEVYTDLYVYVPTSFTPNNDGLNDAWQPSVIGQDNIAKYDCWVFNRTGHNVFHSTDPNEPWIGGNELSGGGEHYSGGAETFVWRIAIKKKDGEGAKVYEGHVTMVR